MCNKFECILGAEAIGLNISSCALKTNEGTGVCNFRVLQALTKRENVQFVLYGKQSASSVQNHDLELASNYREDIQSEGLLPQSCVSYSDFPSIWKIYGLVTG